MKLINLRRFKDRALRCLPLASAKNRSSFSEGRTEGMVQTIPFVEMEDLVTGSQPRSSQPYGLPKSNNEEKQAAMTECSLGEETGSNDAIEALPEGGEVSSFESGNSSREETGSNDAIEALPEGGEVVGPIALSSFESGNSSSEFGVRREGVAKTLGRKCICWLHGIHRVLKLNRICRQHGICWWPCGQKRPPPPPPPPPKPFPPPPPPPPPPPCDSPFPCDPPPPPPCSPPCDPPKLPPPPPPKPCAPPPPKPKDPPPPKPCEPRPPKPKDPTKFKEDPPPPPPKAKDPPLQPPPPKPCPPRFSYEDLHKHFGRKRRDAAKSLGVSESTFKRICRQNGINRWPNRIRNNATLKPSDPHRQENVSPTCFWPDSIEGHGLLEDDDNMTTSEYWTNMFASSTPPSVTLKPIYGQTIMRFQFPRTSGINELKEEVSKRLKLDHDSFDVKYVDEDGDYILIGCDEDLRGYLQLFSSLDNPVIRLFVVDKDSQLFVKAADH